MWSVWYAEGSRGQPARPKLVRLGRSEDPLLFMFLRFYDATISHELGICKLAVDQDPLTTSSKTDDDSNNSNDMVGCPCLPTAGLRDPSMPGCQFCCIVLDCPWRLCPLLA